jgi:Flp pilus assembly protein TadD
MNHSIYSENEYCAYRLSQLRVKKDLAKYDNPRPLLDAARAFANEQKWQLAATTIERILELDEKNEAALELYGFVCFSAGNFTTAREANERIVSVNPSNAYAHKGLGLSLHRLNQSERGLEHLIRATELSSPDNVDAYYDLSIVYNELGRYAEARSVIEQAQRIAQTRIGSMPMAAAP